MKLEIGYNHSFEIRRETYVGTCKDNFTVLYLSDLHLNKYSGAIAKKISIVIDELDPTIILFGGDYVDSSNGFIHLKNLLTSISHRKNMFAVAGNHDYFFGVGEFEKCMGENNIFWIEKKSAYLNLKSTVIKIDGNFVDSNENGCDFSILLLHKPAHINTFKDNYNLAFAGHLHGSQFVFWKSESKLYPGILFYKWNILQKIMDNCQYFISKGLGDTLPIRYNCKKDLLFIQVNSKFIT